MQPLGIGDSSQSIEYASPAPKRPGILTAVGIISIIVGSMSVLGSLSAAYSGITNLTKLNMTFPTPVTTPAPTAMPAMATAPSRSWVGTPQFNFRYPPGPSELTVIESALDLCVAVLLIVAGSVMLRDSPKAWHLHRLYIVLKVPLIIVGAFAMWWNLSSLRSGFNSYSSGGGGAAPMGAVFVIIMVVFEIAFSMIYPTALLIVLSTPKSKEHLDMIRSRITR
jgi:hypothetical protein